LSRLPRLGRAARFGLVAVLIVAAFPVTTAIADLAGDKPTIASATPHLDAVERSLREISPGLEGTVWERTSGNSMDGDDASWLFHTPGCWGDNACADRAGTRAFLDKLTASIGSATRTVDLSTLAPFPNGQFQDAIVAGLKTAASKHRLRVRILIGAVPFGNLGEVPAAYRDQLNAKLGPAAGNVTLHIGSMTTRKTTFSWNHSKILVVDGRSAIVGGINTWGDVYIDTTHPVADTSFALSGPAASSASRYLDTIWGWTCRNSANPILVWYAGTGNAACTATLETTRATATGDVPVIAVGDLGLGIQRNDPRSTYKPTLPTAPDTKCGISPYDYTNADRDYDTVNPEASALRALVSSATSQIEISQQDLHGNCPPMPRYDVRLYDALAAKLIAGVKVRLVLSDPANYGPIGSGYSYIKSLTEVTAALRGRIAAKTGDAAGARATMCGNLQLASFRSAPEARWADGKPYALHNKLVVVDRSTFYLGSRNLYPAWLQDFGYIVESQSATAELKTAYLDREWQYSKATALVDYQRGICPA
jgi:phosphatidylserine/phosphatidylglycerophosphate/cardiolipin synthase-like enzyme